MKKLNLPTAGADSVKGKLRFEPTPAAMDKFNGHVRAATEDKDNTISILDVIGADWFGEGVTAKRIAAALRSIGEEADIVVNINSPGGDLFEGLAIYNMLREHKGKVTVKVLGIAASAASLIAMAGDEIQVAKAGFLMIHNAWVVAFGNRHDLQEVIDYLQPFDDALADVYADRTGIPAAEIQVMLDAETWLNGSKAVELGFADDFLPADQVKEDDKVVENSIDATRKIDQLLAKSNVPRSERRALLKEIKGSKSGAASDSTPRAAESASEMGAAEAELALSLANFQIKTQL